MRPRKPMRFNGKPNRRSRKIVKLIRRRIHAAFKRILERPMMPREPLNLTVTMDKPLTYITCTFDLPARFAHVVDPQASPTLP